MLGNNKPLEGVDLAKVFAAMVGDLPWTSLKAFIQTNSQLAKMATIGGHRMEVKRRNRLEKIVCREAEKDGYAASFANGVFAYWYPVHEQLHKRLEDYFHSDEYKAYRQEHDLADDCYVLSDEKFKQFFLAEELEQWRILLCFSPLQFTDKQAGTVLDGAGENPDLLQKVQDLEAAVEQYKKRSDLAAADMERARQEQQKASSEAQELRKLRRELTKECESLRAKFETSQADNRKLRSTLDEKHEEVQQKHEEISARSELEISRAASDRKRLQAELDDWRGKYEQQRANNRRLREELAQANGKLEEEAERVQAAQQRVEYLSSFADLVLDRIDWPKVGAQMKLTPTLRRQFNSLIRKLDYEEDGSLTLEGTLTEFWNKLQAKEKALIEAVAQSNTQEVVTGDVSAFWQGLTDSFEDVVIGLEGRTVMVRMLQDIFYQVLEAEDLEVPKIPQKANSRR